MNLPWHIIITQNLYCVSLLVLLQFMALDKCIMICNHNYVVIQNSITDLKLPCFHLFIPPTSQSLATADLFTVSIVFPLLKFSLWFAFLAFWWIWTSFHFVRFCWLPHNILFPFIFANKPEFCLEQQVSSPEWSPDPIPSSLNLLISRSGHRWPSFNHWEINISLLGVLERCWLTR